MAGILAPAAHTASTPSPSPTIGLSPTSLSFTGVQGGANPSAQILTVTNTGGGTLSWSVSDNATWLTLSPASGTAPGSATVSVTLTGLTVGTYNATITVTALGATNSPQTAPVTLTVTAAPVPPTIGLSPSSLSFTGVQSGANPANQTLSITNTGGGTMSWSVSDSAAWLTLSPASGSSTPGTVTASVSLAGLAAGTYNATITVTALGATNTPQTVPVTLTITAPPPPVGQSASVTSVVTDATGATITIQGLGQVLEFVYDAQPSYTAISGFTAGTASFRHNFAWPQGTTFACYRTKGTDNVYIGYICNTVTSGPPPPPTSGTAVLTWNPNAESDLAGYKVYRGTQSGVYGAPITTLQGNVTTYNANGLQIGTTYFFAITAYDTAGNESGYSNEVSKSIF